MARLIGEVSSRPQTVFPFFVGAGRSGTTLLRAMIDSHPDVAIPPESGFVARLGSKRETFERPDGFATKRFIKELFRGRFPRWDIPLEEVQKVIGSPPIDDFADAIRRVYSLHAARQGKQRYGDKTPGYVFQISLLGSIFPESKFVHIIRDGRDVALSQVDNRDWGPQTIEHAAIEWKSSVRAGRSQGKFLEAGRYYEIRYERLIDDPEQELRKLCVFLELGFEETMLHYFSRAGELAGSVPHFQNLYKPPTKGLRDWRIQMPRNKVGVFEALAGDMLNELGYERAFPKLPIRVCLRASFSRLFAQSRRVRSQAQRATRRTFRIGGRLADRST